MPVNDPLVLATSHDHPTHSNDDVRLIGDILPFVLSKYGIDLCDDPLAVTQDAQLEYDFAI
jgi:hypothetical protein